MLSTHDRNCLSCVRSGNCELQKLCQDYGVDDEAIFDGEKHASLMIDDSAAAYGARQQQVHPVPPLCGRLRQASRALAVIGANDRGFDTHIGCAFEHEPGRTWPASSCGQCIVVCPTGALTEKDNTKRCWRCPGRSDQTRSRADRSCHPC